ncbi:uncharacterized protein LAESUDRAFT_736450 [Laetiporus sulphureus 93-53]|uniref:Integral membrane protein n=1 Tax=Laetiporus sulphureus 93-53 TaxID=1314785 RepID=A0A165EQE1_9APHY|nr:uncharacterized protein LAESUDRAFT_736450 [Laetiporus sulphureus 93-53]KZT07546.1 hypothetical protein LAESUDRAFT_736450 [Laetiporus sulphureus 93-53]
MRSRAAHLIPEQGVSSSGNTPSSWPSLYNWVIEVWPIENRAPVQRGGFYLSDAHEIFRFTLYWTLIFYMPAYILCGIYAFFNVSFPPKRENRETYRARPTFNLPFTSFGAAPTITVNEIPMTPRSMIPPDQNRPLDADAMAALAHYRARLKPNERRSRLTFAFLIFITFTALSLAGAVIGSAIVGYVLAGVYKAGHFNMTTWMPFLAGLLQTLVGFLGLWPTIVDII